MNRAAWYASGGTLLLAFSSTVYWFVAYSIHAFAGLGLAICREIANLHGGKVSVFSPAGSDLAAFFFDLRRAD